MVRYMPMWYLTLLGELLCEPAAAVPLLCVGGGGGGRRPVGSPPRGSSAPRVVVWIEAAETAPKTRRWAAAGVRWAAAAVLAYLVLIAPTVGALTRHSSALAADQYAYAPALFVLAPASAVVVAVLGRRAAGRRGSARPGGRGGAGTGTAMTIAEAGRGGESSKAVGIVVSTTGTAPASCAAPPRPLKASRLAAATTRALRA